jgi:DNA-binding NtrC family response regulator
MLLKLKGFDASYACNLSEALEQIKTQPTAVLLDLMLPDGNGATVLDHIRRNNLPIRVAITSGASNWKSLIGEGPSKPDAFFSKPLQIDQLVGWLTDAADTLVGTDQ